MPEREQVFIGMMRVKNEEAWLERSIKSISQLCDVVFVMDDASTDKSREIVWDLDKTVSLASPWGGFPLNETRDKNWLLEMIIRTLPAKRLNIDSPYWLLCIDGDEALEATGAERVRKFTDPEALAYSMKIQYLWDSEDLVRVDGVYRNFRRPSMFRLINPGFKFKETGSKGNLHCSSVPQEFLGHAKLHGESVEDGGHRDTCLLHYGYLRKEDRVRKFKWYNTVDPNNAVEDYYQHMIQGDGPVVMEPGHVSAKVAQGIPADERLRWAGPLELEPLP